jgi:hypothetical protein
MAVNQKWLESLEPQLGKIRQELARRDPARIVADSGAVWHRNNPDSLELEFFGRPHTISTTDFLVRDGEGRISSNLEQVFLLQYLLLADGTPLTGSWVSLAELPDGAFYERAFQSYSGSLVARAFRGRPEKLREIALSLGGEAVQMGDLAFRFRALPRIPLALVYWTGGDEFPDSAQVLFDRSASRYHHLEMLAHIGAVLCERVLGRMKRDAESEPGEAP